MSDYDYSDAGDGGYEDPGTPQLDPYDPAFEDQVRELARQEAAPIVDSLGQPAYSEVRALREEQAQRDTVEQMNSAIDAAVSQGGVDKPGDVAYVRQLALGFIQGAQAQGHELSEAQMLETVRRAAGLVRAAAAWNGTDARHRPKVADFISTFAKAHSEVVPLPKRRAGIPEGPFLAGGHSRKSGSVTDRMWGRS